MRKLRSGMASPPAACGARLERRKELVNLFPNGLAAGDTVPVHANEPHQLVAFVDRHQVVGAGSADAIDKQRFGVGLERLQLRVVTGQVAPGRKLEQRSEEHTSELQSRVDLVCRLLLE